LPLEENESVQLTIHRHRDLAEQIAGMIGWKGDAETFERLLAESDEDRLYPVDDTDRKPRAAGRDINSCP
jgi:hypothetical protein